jgi:hypothetical protein
MALSKEQLKAIHAKNGSSGVSSRSIKPNTKQATIKRPAKKPKIRIPKGDIRSMLTEKEINEWEKVAGSELISAETGRFEGKDTIEVKFQNGQEWFEFQTMKEQNDWFSNYYPGLDKVPKEKPGHFVELDHPKVEGYVTLLSGISLFKDRLRENNG